MIEKSVWEPVRNEANATRICLWLKQIVGIYLPPSCQTLPPRRISPNRRWDLQYSLANLSFHLPNIFSTINAKFHEMTSDKRHNRRRVTKPKLGGSQVWSSTLSRHHGKCQMINYVYLLPLILLTALQHTHELVFKMSAASGRWLRFVGRIVGHCSRRIYNFMLFGPALC